MSSLNDFAELLVSVRCAAWHRLTVPLTPCYQFRCACLLSVIFQRRYMMENTAVYTLLLESHGWTLYDNQAIKHGTILSSHDSLWGSPCKAPFGEWGGGCGRRCVPVFVGS